LQHLQQETDVWAHQLLNRMSNTVGDDELDSWAIRIDPEQTPAVISMLEQGRKVTLRMLYRNPRQRDRMLPAFALLLRNADGVRILPGELTELQPGDELLCCGLDNVLRQMEWTVNNYNVLYYVITGEDPPHSLLARLLRRQEQESL
jgi:aryl carrier-like protein